jgi:hypothetical protein
MTMSQLGMYFIRLLGPSQGLSSQSHRASFGRNTGLRESAKEKGHRWQEGTSGINSVPSFSEYR